MTNTQKAGLCGFAVAVLGFLGSLSPQCKELPAPWNSACLGGAKVADVASKHFTVPDGGRP